MPAARPLGRRRHVYLGGEGGGGGERVCSRVLKTLERKYGGQLKFGDVIYSNITLIYKTVSLQSLT